MAANNPFPGLRPFNFEDNHLFFGRDEQITELASRLRKNRFVAVVGTSGSGKSSLVRAGLLPELFGGTMVGAGSRWQTSIMRPGGNPIEQLAKGLIEADLYDPDEEDVALQVMATLTRSGLGLVEAIRQSDLESGENFLLVVDQFEEIFRFRKASNDSDERAIFFVNLLLEAVAQSELPIYVIITMRSDFLGECSRFPRLANVVNEGEFLIPRLNREQRKQAILGPVKVAGGQISEPLLSRLLNDIGDDPDQLPILQHALMRTWEHTTTDGGHPELDLSDYRATGGMQEALSRHADEIYIGLGSDRERWVVEKLFKSLTEKVDSHRGIRRPITYRELCEMVGESDEMMLRVIDAFRSPGRTFLMPGVETTIQAETVVDISHESLMRVWVRLRDWVEDEAQSAKIYRRLAETAQLHEQGKAGLYRNPDLQIAISWHQENRPNQTWADRYFPGFQLAMTFLERSQEEDQAQVKAEEAARQKELSQARDLATAQEERAEALKANVARNRKYTLVLGLLAVGLFLTAIQTVKLRNKAETEREQVRVDYLVNQLAQVDQHTDRKDFQKALGSLKGIEPANVTEQRLLTTRLIGAMSETFYPRRVAEHYALNERAIFPNGGIVSEDGRYICIGADYDNSGHVHLVDLEGKNPEFHFGDIDSVLRADYNDPAKRYAVGYKFQGDYFASVFRVAQGDKFPNDVPLDDAPLKLNFDEQGRWLAVLTVSGMVTIIDGDREVLSPTQHINTGGRCLNASFNRKADRLYVVFDDDQGQYVKEYTLRANQWEESNQAAVRLHDGKIEFVHAKWAPHREELLFFGNSEDQKPVFGCFDAQTLTMQERVGIQNYHKAGGINTMHISHDGSFVINPCMDNTCSITDYETGRLLHQVRQPANVYFSLLSPNQQMLMVGDWLGFRLWDPYSGEPLTSYVKLGEGMRGACFLENGRILRIVTMNSNVFDYEVNGLPPQQQRVQGVNSVLDLHGGQELWMGQQKGLSQWDQSNGAYQQVNMFDGFQGKCHLVRGSHEKMVLAIDYTYPNPSQALVFEADESGGLSPLNARKFPITNPSVQDLETMILTPDGKYLVYNEWNLRTLNLYSVQEGKLIQNIDFPLSTSSIEVSPDSSHLLIFRGPDLITIFSLPTLEKVNELKHMARYGGAIRFDSSGQMMATFGSGDKSGVLWRYRGPTEIEKVADFSHQSGISSLDFSQNSRWMASGSQDGVVSIWDLEGAGNGLIPVNQIQHDREVAGLRFVGNGNDSILTCDEAATIRIWDRHYGVIEAGPFVMGDAEVAQTGNARYDFDLFGNVFVDGEFISLIARSSPLVIQRVPNLTDADALPGRDVERAVEVLTAWGGNPSRSLSLAQVQGLGSALLESNPSNLMGDFIRWYQQPASSRSVTPLQEISIEDYIRDNLGSEDIRVVSQLLRLAPDEPAALARFGHLYMINDNHGALSQRLQVAKWYLSVADLYSGPKRSAEQVQLASLIDAQGERID